MAKNLIITNDGSHTLFDKEINECYHSKHGAIIEAMHVFIKNGIFAVDKQNLNILEIGFGTGLNALLTAQKSKEKSIKINYNTIELYPIEAKYYTKLNFSKLMGIDKKELEFLHSCSWDIKHKISSYFNFKKKHISVEDYNTTKKYDIIYYDAFSPRKQPEMWEKKIFSKMYKFLKNDGFLVTYCAKGDIKRTLKECGFRIIALDGPPGKRQITRANKNLN